ncbi:MAG: GGDEF domain-containing protein [Raoultibacter sp.]
MRPRVKKSALRLVSYVLCLALALPCALVAFPETGSAAEAGRVAQEAVGGKEVGAAHVVRVGYPIQSKLTDRNESGDYTGYTYDFLQRIAQYTGWTYEFVTYEGSLNEQLNAALADLESGNIDLLGGMSYSEELAQKYLYPSRNYGVSSSALLVPDTGSSITASNLYSTPDLKIAVRTKAKQRRADLQTYADLINISYEEVECATEEELIQAVFEGRAHAALGVDLSVFNDFHVIARFASKPFYFAAAPGSEEHIASLDAALARIEDSEPTFATDLFTAYFGGENLSLDLNEMERAYIASAPVLRVGVVPDRAPLQYLDEKTGQLAGVSIDVLTKIAGATGLRFEYVTLDNGRPVGEQVQEHDLDLIAGLSDAFALVQDCELSLSLPYISSQTMAAFRENVWMETLRTKRCAVPNELLPSVVAEGIDATGYATIDDCLRAVSENKADFTYGSSYVIPYYLSASGYSGLRTAPSSDKLTQMCFGVVRPVAVDLISILNKSVQNIAPTELSTMVYSHSFPDQELGLRALVERYPIPFAVGVLTVALLGAILAWIYGYNRARAARRDSLTGIYHAAAFRRKVEPVLSSAKGERSAFLVADIDDFKQVNDSCGHYVGDEVLKVVADVLKQSAEPGDEVGRLGGDEFLMFWVNGSRETLDARCEALIAAIEKAMEGHTGSSTLSIGVACVRSKEEYDALYRRADTALYDAKHVGKHTYVISE